MEKYHIIIWYTRKAKKKKFQDNSAVLLMQARLRLPNLIYPTGKHIVLGPMELS